MPKEAFASAGFALVPEVIPADQCEEIAAYATSAASQPNKVGSRSVLEQPWCAALAQTLRQCEPLSQLIPPTHVAVQCTYFEKSRDQNWLVALHQDLSIAVASRVDEAGLRGWSEKEGTLYVQAPLDTLQQLIAVRLHLDPCEMADGPLRVVPGSHQFGVLSPSAAQGIRAERDEVSCALAQGGVLVMRPLLLHASSKASGISRRRVLHFVYGPPALPHGLRWKNSV